MSACETFRRERDSVIDSIVSETTERFCKDQKGIKFAVTQGRRIGVNRVRSAASAPKYWALQSGLYRGSVKHTEMGHLDVRYVHRVDRMVRSPSFLKLRISYQPVYSVRSIDGLGWYEAEP